MFGAIEAGGTKFVCATRCPGEEIGRKAVIPTRDPDSTFAEVAAFFREAAPDGLTAMGIGTFGPVDLDPASGTFGCILATPKPGWQGADMLARVRAFADVPMTIDTDVNAAALAEAARATGAASRNLAYVTIGTGIGVGLVLDGRPVHGTAHPEMGHMLVRRHPDHGDYPGFCPYHGDCLEGLAAGPAVIGAFGTSADQLPADHPFWEIEAYYVAQLCMNLFLTTAPERIVLGGGVMQQARLLPLIRARTAELLAGYAAGITDAASLERRIVPPAGGEAPGLIGALLLAEGLSADAA